MKLNFDRARIKYIALNFFIVSFIVASFYIYLFSRESNFMLLMAGVFFFAALSVYDIYHWVHGKSRNSSDESQADIQETVETAHDQDDPGSLRFRATVKYLLINFVLIFLIIGSFYIYLFAREPDFRLFLFGVAAVVIDVVYNIYVVRSTKIDEDPVEESDDHVAPLDCSNSNGGVPAIQVDPKVQDSIRIGKNYYNGRGLPRDFFKAFNLLFEGALAGDAEAQMYVGKMFMYGQGIAPSMINGKTWLEASAFQGNAEAQYLLGTVYSSNEDTVSLLKAVYFLTKSAEQGNNKARMHLNNLYRNNTAAQRADLKSVPADSFYDYANNPFISGICITANQSKARKSVNSDLSRAYRILNVSPSSEYEEIRQAYLNLMLKFHPDKNRVDSQKVLLVRDAYDLVCRNLKEQGAR